MRNKRYAKLASLLMTAVLLCSLFAACGDGGTTTAAGDSAATPSEDSGNGDSTGTAAADVTIRVEVFDRATQGGSDPTNNMWTRWIDEQMRERHGIGVEFVSVPRSEEIPQLNVLMAGGDAPDIVFTYTHSVVYNYYRQGGVADLTDVVEQHGPNIKSYLGDEILSYGEFDGRLHMIPAKRIARGIMGTYMRKDWLDTLGLPVPTNLDEFTAALQAFKDENPGNVEQVIPYAAASDLPTHIVTVTDSFIDTAALDDETAFVYAIDQSNTLLYPGFKEGIRYFNQLYNDGLMDPQFPLYKDFSPVDDLIARGVVGAFTGNYDYPMRTTPGVYNNLKANVEGAELVPVDCFPNAEGKNLKAMYLPTGIYTFIPAASKNIEAAVKYLDFLCEYDTMLFLTTGEEGVHHTKDEEGIPVMINLENDDRMMNSPNNLDYALVVNGVDLGDESQNVKVLSKSYEAGYEDIFEEAYYISIKDAVVFNPLIVPTESEAQFSNTLSEKRKEILASAITTTVDNFDAVYDAGIQEWLDIGGQQCVDERQAYWDEHMK